VTHHVIGNGETHKSLSTIEKLCSEFAQAGLTRADVVVGVGGGMVTDVAGFAAASYHRGIAVVHVATTLLAMIDAAIGGKTGVNIAEGKNLVGAFWQPHGVACEMDALATLPEREMRCGLGEMAKYHFIAREDFTTLPLLERVARCVEIKANIVSADEREGGQRALLNYGHTLAHALEIATNFSIAHGEAVAIGVLYAAHLAHRMDRIDSARLDQHYDVVHGLYGLRHALPQGITPEQLIVDMGRDKKAIDSLTFVLDSPNGLEVIAGVSEKHIREALADLTLRLS
jgi:5-deoxy-5-amino-3-dehydroquinate synthase